MRPRYVILGLALALCACSSSDTGVGVTANRDYTLTVTVRDRFIRVGDAIPINVRLSRTDNSNLPSGLKGTIQLTSSKNGSLVPESITVSVTGADVTEVSENVTFRGTGPGSAEVRAAFQDAAAKVEVVISGVTS